MCAKIKKEIYLQKYIDKALYFCYNSYRCLRGEVSERFKELVLKTSDSKEPWVRIPPSPPMSASCKASPFLCLVCRTAETILILKWRSTQVGRRGSPAKGVGWETGARVRISPSPPEKEIRKYLFFVWRRRRENANA